LGNLLKNTLFLIIFHYISIWCFRNYTLQL